MKPAIYHKPHRAEHFIIQSAKALIRIAFHAKFFVERLGIKRPAFDIGCVAAKAHKRRKRGIFLSQADLEMMSRCCFMEVQRFHAGCGAGGQIIAVEIENAGA